MNLVFRTILSLLLPAIVLLHLWWAPYTKVEESFNIQAIHDILKHGIPLRHVYENLAQNFDHVAFPGSVPRTFVGALAVAELSRPWARWLPAGVQVQTLVRGILGLGNALVLLSFQDAVRYAFGSVAAVWYLILQASQFHVMYYASRTIPNMFAFGFTTMALRYVMLAKFGPQIRRARRSRHAIYYLTLAGIIFRSEVAILLATETLVLTVSHRASLSKLIIPAGLTAAAIGLTVTIVVDSFFWQEFPIWPEWIAFLYNTIEGKSADWGTSPWYFYFTDSLPRLLLNPMSWLVCIPIAMMDRSLGRFSNETLAPLYAFVGIYSFLPHKEWRFIIYVVPGMTAVASAGAAWIWTRRARSLLHRVLCLALIGSVPFSFFTSAGLLAISSLNYPGAHALERLHNLADGSQATITVYLDNLSCQTGVTRFLQISSPSSKSKSMKTEGSIWIYDKTEDEHHLTSPVFWDQFDYVLAERPELVIGRWKTVDVVQGFAGISLSKELTNKALDSNAKDGRHIVEIMYHRCESWIRTRLTHGWWLKVKMEPKIRIMKREH